MINSDKTKEQLLKENDRLKAQIADYKESEKNEIFYNTILNNMGDPVFVKDHKSRLLLVNDAFCEIFNLTRSEIIGKTLAEEVPLEEREQFLEIDKQVILTGKENITEESLTVKGNKTKIISTRKTRFTDNNDNQFLVGIIRDISERKQAEKVLKESEDKFKSLVTNSEGIVYLIDKDGFFLLSEGKGLSLLGLKPGEVVGKSVFDIYKDYPDMLEEMKRVFQGETISSEVLIADTIHFKNWYSPQLSASNEIIGLIGLTIDISELKQAEEALKLSEQKFKNQVNFLDTIINQSPFAMWISDATGTLIRSNLELRNILNVTDEQIVGKYNVLYDENLKEQGLSTAVKAVFEDFQPARFVVYWIGEKVGRDFEHTNVKSLWIDVSMFPIIDENGDLINVVCQYVDITDRKQVESTLREIHARHSALIENIGDVIAIVSDDGITKYQSPNIEKWFGWKPEDLIGTNGWDMMHSDDIERIQIEFSKILVKETPSIVEYRFKCKDGTYKWIELTAVNRINDPAINGVLLNYHDITDRKLAEKSLKESEEKLNLIINASPIGICTADHLGNFSMTNPAYERIVGYSKEECRSLSFFDVTHPNDRPKNKKLFQAMFSLESTNFSIKKRYIRKDGSEIDVDVHAIGIMDTEGNVRFGTAFVDDITESKKAEEELKNHRDHLEELVLERTEDLKKKNKELDAAMKVFVGRELTIRDLQQRIKALGGKI
jgi:PAS domain S-box-containing protein